MIRRLLRRVPAGVASGPFEFAVALGYLLTALHLLTNDKEYDQVRRVLFPSGGLFAWCLVLVVSTTSVIAGQLLQRRFLWGGLRLERYGLLGVAAALGAYVWAVWDYTSGLSTAVETVGATFVACLYKSAIIGTALDGARLLAKRKRGPDRDDG